MLNPPIDEPAQDIIPPTVDNNSMMNDTGESNSSSSTLVTTLAILLSLSALILLILLILKCKRLENPRSAKPEAAEPKNMASQSLFASMLEKGKVFIDSSSEKKPKKTEPTYDAEDIQSEETQRPSMISGVEPLSASSRSSVKISPKDQIALYMDPLSSSSSSSGVRSPYENSDTEPISSSSSSNGFIALSTKELLGKDFAISIPSTMDYPTAPSAQTSFIDMSQYGVGSISRKSSVREYETLSRKSSTRYHKESFAGSSSGASTLEVPRASSIASTKRGILKPILKPAVPPAVTITRSSSMVSRFSSCFSNILRSSFDVSHVSEQPHRQSTLGRRSSTVGRFTVVTKAPSPVARAKSLNLSSGSSLSSMSAITTCEEDAAYSKMRNLFIYNNKHERKGSPADSHETFETV